VPPCQPLQNLSQEFYLRKPNKLSKIVLNSSPES
jgi:hypothetical protein